MQNTITETKNGKNVKKQPLTAENGQHENTQNDINKRKKSFWVHRNWLNKKRENIEDKVK